MQLRKLIPAVYILQAAKTLRWNTSVSMYFLNSGQGRSFVWEFGGICWEFTILCLYNINLLLSFGRDVDSKECY